MYFEKFSVVLGHFPKTYCAKHLLGTKATKASSLQNEPQLWLLEFSASHKLTESRTARYRCGTYLQFFTGNLTVKKS